MTIKCTVRQYKDYKPEIVFYDNGELTAWHPYEGHSLVDIAYYRITRPVDNDIALPLVERYNRTYGANLRFVKRLNHSKKI